MDAAHTGRWNFSIIKCLISSYDTNQEKKKSTLKCKKGSNKFGKSKYDHISKRWASFILQ